MGHQQSDQASTCAQLIHFRTAGLNGLSAELHLFVACVDRYRLARFGVL
jgi:hypothetical protein